MTEKEWTKIMYHCLQDELSETPYKFESGPFIEVQVKSLRSMGYVFVQKAKFSLRNHLYLALGILRQKRPPALYLIPATAWTETNALFVSRDYEGLNSRPEWGLNVSQKNLPLLEHHRFDVTVQGMVGEAANGYASR